MIIEVAITAAAAAVVLYARELHHRRLLRESEMEIQGLKTRFDQELFRARQERDRLLDALGDPFMLVNSSGRIRFANAAAHELFGKRELLDRPVREAFIDPRLTDSLLHCLESGEAIQSRIVLPQQSSPRGDAETRGINAWIIDAARLPSADGTQTITRVVIRDITAEHQTEQIRKDFVANASHELRTPMAIINGYLENLLDDGMLEEPDTARHFLSIMRKHSQRISRIVEDMLVISRLESGEANSLKIEPFKLQSCVNDIHERLESVISNNDATIKLSIPEDGPVIHGDRFYWTQVLFNLVENALKQNPHPGLNVEIGYSDNGDSHCVWVADNGIGIPSADLAHIFRRFYRVEKHHSQREIKGTGLGLSIVKRA
ncbi:MAG: sensor histidine kinase, partial [Verrucomicrobiales bacterium]